MFDLTNRVHSGWTAGEQHFFLKEFKSYFSGKFEFCFIPIKTHYSRIDELLRNLSKKDIIIALIFDAQANKTQRELLKRLQNHRADVIFVLIENPFDIEFLDRNETCIITYGYRKSQLSSLLKVIFGKIKANGCLPFKRIEA